MKPVFWYFFIFCFQIELLTGEIDDSANFDMFTFHNGGVQILCKYPEKVQQFKMELLKGRQVLCELTKIKTSGNVVSINNMKFCQSQLSNNSVSFFLNNLDNSHGSYYVCNLSIFDPPPFEEKILSREYLHIYESQLCCQLKFWLPIGCAAFVIVYTLGCYFIFRFTKKKYGSSVHDPNSDYMFMAAVNAAKKPRLAGMKHVDQFPATWKYEMPSIPRPQRI
ncbi:inducible T-cell costimulator isoform X1 [Marmota marmota marmota]|uniref:inducible T-cell costimulator isoform X1 n=1 Tax=Marmota marmota marmota TaxID=9994 RepID=UPI00209345FA|nr:inducible T-cell costimulator isoform X1 [Marmota marmota marmota]